MDRVEFYMDGNKLGDATVAPYSVRWTIKMTDVVPKSGPTVYATRVITNPDGTVTTEQVIERETKTEKYKKADGTTAQHVIVMTRRRRRRDRHGREAARDPHRSGSIAYDKAGNKIKSAPVRIFVQAQGQGGSPSRKPRPRHAPHPGDERRRLPGARAARSGAGAADVSAA